MANLTVILFLCISVPMGPALYMIPDKRSKLFLCFMLLYPIMTLAGCFIYAKGCGIRIYMPFAMLPIVAAEYILFENFRAIQPNIFVTTLFGMLFGSGIGNIFADKKLIEQQKKARRDRRLHEDKKYRKILDD
jgi:hypothetical protein